MTDEAVLLAAILADREEDTPRLVYADCIEEDQPERAEFIRTQIALTKIDEPKDMKGAELIGWRVGYCCELKVMDVMLEISRHDGECGLCFRCRERELLDAHGFDWCGIGNGWKVDGREKYGNVVTVRYYAVPSSYGRYVFTFIRGFAGQVECPWVCWHTHADAILARQPIERVRLTTFPGHDDEKMRELADKYRYNWLPTDMGPGQMNARRFAIEMFAKEWPRIEFEFAATRTEQYGLQELPLPIIHSDFEFTARRIEQSRRRR